MSLYRIGIITVAALLVVPLLRAANTPSKAALPAIASEQDTLPPLENGEIPKTFDALWKGFDPQKEPLDVEVLKEWEEDGVVMKVIRYRVAIFNGKKAMMAANYGCPGSADAAAGKPFFLYLAHVAPHDPRQYPARFMKRYNAAAVSLPPNCATRHPFDNGELLVRDELLEAHPRRPEAVRQHIADYYALIALIDEQVGRLLDSLEESGQAQNTIVVFAADNGLAVGQHGLMGKQNLYDHSVRVPLVFAGPGIPEGETADDCCDLLDIFPGLCDLAGLPTPESVEGQSLGSAIKEPATDIRDSLHFAYRGVQRGVRVGQHKLIEDVVNGKRTTQLFDLETDPHETTNLATRPEHTEAVASLHKELERWRTELGDGQEPGRQFWRA